VTSSGVFKHVVEQCRDKNVHVLALDRRDQVEHFDQVVYVGFLASPFATMVSMGLGGKCQGFRQALHLNRHDATQMQFYRRLSAIAGEVVRSILQRSIAWACQRL